MDSKNNLPDDIEAYLAEVEARANRATPGPWKSETWYCSEGSGGWAAVGPHHTPAGGETDEPESDCAKRAESDANFIASARDEVPRLITIIRAQQTRIASLEYTDDGLVRPEKLDADLREEVANIDLWQHETECATPSGAGQLIFCLREQVSEQDKHIAKLESEKQSVVDGMTRAITAEGNANRAFYEMQKERDVLRERLDKLESCIVCTARLLPGDKPPHCEDSCIVNDEHQAEWEGFIESPAHTRSSPE